MTDDLIKRLREAWKTSSENSLLISEAADRIQQLTKQRDELLAALENAVSVAKTAHECWDNDQDMKVGKYLIALSGGLPGYDKRTDEIHAAIASVKGQA